MIAANVTPLFVTTPVSASSAVLTVYIVFALEVTLPLLAYTVAVKVVIVDYKVVIDCYNAARSSAVAPCPLGTLAAQLFPIADNVKI